MANYQIWYADDVGNRLAQIKEYTSFEYSKVLGDVGICAVSIPIGHDVYHQRQIDRRIHIYRQPVLKPFVTALNPAVRNFQRLGPMALDFVGCLRTFVYQTDRRGQTVMTLVGFDLNHLLLRRVNAYYAGSAQADVTGNADDLMKEVVRDNFIDNADYSGTPDPARDIDSYGFSVAADLSAGPSITKAIAWQRVLDILQDLQADSKTGGTECFFGVVPTSETTMEFRTWTGQPGADKTSSTGNFAVVFSLDWGNLESPNLTYDYSDEITYMYAGGRGQNDARVLQTTSDTTGLTRSRLNRIEGFVETGEELNAPTLAAARREISLHRPRVELTARLLDNPVTPYGYRKGWQFGDKVTVNYVGQQFDTIIRSVHVQVDADGKETIRSRIESE